ncbi:PKD-like domain-containing protein [Mucilaginibacter sp. dw_454]|uniref:Ig-like domain-containing protein n=1 Tax=Mucilaginibacter sp. dw_454 TaxID=2720079 RepID=UPI001BD27623|nr:PKD-like domain-containing protein [Mucilaginibacter sp. dw_454]
MKFKILVLLFLAITIRLYGQTAPAPTASNTSTCYGTGAALHASGPAGAIFNWYTTPTGGTSIISSPDYTTPPLTANTTYYVELTATDGSVSSRTAVNITINPLPATPTVADVTICSGNVATLTATAPGGSYNWYATPTSTAVLSSTNTYVTPVLNVNTDFYVESVSGTCTSARTVVHVIVNPTPTAPTVSDQTICSGSVAMLTALGPGGTYSWYAGATAVTPLFTGDTYTTPALTASQTYYVETTVGNCTSPRIAVKVIVNPIPAAPTATGIPVCSGSSTSLTATGTGSSFEWYKAATGGIAVATTATFNTPALTTTTTYYVQTIANGCISPRTPVIVTVNPLPAAPTVSGTTPICAGTTATLTASGTGTINWYSAASGGTPLASNTSTFTTPALGSTKTYYVGSDNGTCASTLTPVTVNVIPGGNQFSYSSGTYCKSGTNPVPTITMPGGTFSAAPAGLVINAGTGEIDLTASTVRHYTITYTNGCAISTQRIAIVVTPDAGFSYSAPDFCQNGANPAPVFTATGSAGIFSSSAGLVFVNAQSGVIDIKNSTPGPYLVTNTINSGGCAPVSVSTNITIDEGVIVSAGSNQTVAIGTPAQLAGTITGAVSTGTWSGGTGNFSSYTDLNATYTGGPGETTAVLTLTSDNPGTACGSQFKTVTITFAPKPAAPIVAPVLPICSGSSTVLSVNPPYAGNYKWYNAAVGGTPLGSNTTLNVRALTATTIYYVQTTVGGVASDRTAVTVTVNPIPAAPTVAPVAPICYGTQATVTATGPGGTYDWYDKPTGGNLLFTGDTYTSPLPLTANTSYYVQTTSATCTSTTRTQVDVVVNPLPSVTSATTGTVCSGNALNYLPTANITGTTFTFSRAAVTGISNAAVANQPVTTLSETLINTTASSVNVTYVITPNSNGCDGVPFNYVVTVYPTPVVTSANSGVVCSGTSPNYTIQFNTAGTSASWSRAVQPGISNAGIASQASNTIYEALINTTNVPVDVNYIFNYSANGCSGSTFIYTLTVNPSVVISSPATGTICSGVPQSYVITSQLSTATYSWSRPAVAGNAAVTNNTSGIINEALVNTTAAAISVPYTITVTNGCMIGTFTYTVTVNPQPPTPIVSSNSPVCTGSTIKLTTPTVFPGATYVWAGPNGFTSNQQNPVITNVTAANQGVYTLSILANSCTSNATPTTVLVDALPVANAGPDTVSCPGVPAVQLAGNVSGGTTTGVWTTSGTGTFSPSATTLPGQYLPSAQDFATGSVKLTLASTSNDDCTISTDDMTITFKQSPAADAGPDQTICSQNPVITFNAKMLAPYNGTWTSSGTGTFNPPSAIQTGTTSPTYILSAADQKLSSIKFTLTSNTADPCYMPADDMTVTLAPPPTVDAGPDKFVLKGNTTTLTPTVSNPAVTYQWSPNVDINDVNVKNPVITGNVDRVYKLTITDALGCIATDSVKIKIAPKIVITNTFTPNNDGVNDYWVIPGLTAYANATVDVFDRNGQKVFHSVGYGTPWDGTFNGKPLPFGTYYYIVDTKILKPPFSGFVVIIK